MVFTKDASPTRNWSQLAIDFNSYISDDLHSNDITAIQQRIDRPWSDAEKKELVEVFTGKKRKGLTNSGIKYLLSKLEVDRPDFQTAILCRLLESLVDVISAEGDRKREKNIVKADAVAVLSRITRKRLLLKLESQKSQTDVIIENSLFKMLHTIGLKDNRFNLKVRVTGLVQAMCRAFVKQDSIPDSFYTLLIKLSRSPRNGQMIGRHEGFMARLLYKINILNSATTADLVYLLDKHLQILFFTLKNRRTRIQMIRDSFTRSIVEILRKHLCASSQFKPSRLLSSIFGTFDSSIIYAHWEVVIGCLAILRLLSTNKKARDELIALGTMELCSKQLREFSGDEKNATKAKIVESLCALCVRCMPPVAFPLENVRFPLEFPLPQVPPTPGGRVRNSSSINISFDNGRSSDEDGMDEYDDAFNDNNTSNFEQSDEDDAKEEGTTPLPLPKTTKLSAVQLNKYAPFFCEMQTGTIGSTEPIVDTNNETWKSHCEKTKHVMPIRELLPYEMFVAESSSKEKLVKTTGGLKKIIVDELEKSSSRLPNSAKVVYDLDAIAFDASVDLSPPPPNGRFDPTRDLIFESRFESGNLRRATQVDPSHYELVLTPDLNQLREHYQWFFFQVSNMRKGVTYSFEIVNCMKSTSMYSQGMQPVMFSVLDSSLGWRRIGDNVCYYRNLYTSGNAQVDERSGEEKKKKNFYSIRFDVTFQHTGDICYFAYHYPYTYSTLNLNLLALRRIQLSAVYCREDVIGYSLAGNPMKMLTITSPCSAQEIVNKQVIVISARVHPGESNSSWVMQGVLESLLCGSSNEMYRLRENFVFKIIPMLNPDGVINGSHRCSLAGIDLNRVWDRPNEALHREIYNAKAIIQYLCEVLDKKPFAYVDLHGHSKKWDCFVFGNNASESWRKEEVLEQAGYDEDEHMALPRAMDKTMPDKFNISECRFNITRTKESSARVNVWRQFEITSSYTLECTYSGFQLSHNKGYQINIGDLKEIGRDLLLSFLQISQKEQ